MFAARGAVAMGDLASRLLPLRDAHIGSAIMTAPRLQRDITAVLALKLVLLTALYLMFFRGDERPAIDAQRAAQHLLSSEAPR
jgi:hypothetical protein